jgi:hypothetical protein
MGYTAVNLANSEFDQSGFDTKREAEAYILDLVCETCAEDVKRGRIEDEEDGVTVTYPVESVLDTQCGSVWLLITDEEFEEAEDIQDLFIASGMEPADDKTASFLSPQQQEKLEKKRKERDEEERNKERQDDVPDDV